MSLRARIAGVGQVAAGDDAVGFAVIDELRRRGTRPGIELLQLRDPTALLELVEAAVPLVVVDAVVGPSPGTVLAIEPHDIAPGIEPVSSHGFDVAEVLRLAGHLTGSVASMVIHLVGIAIPRPRVGQVGLCPEVASVIAPAADLALVLASRREPPLRAHRPEPTRG